LILRVSRLMLVAVLKDCVTETEDTWASNTSISLAESASERVRRGPSMTTSDDTTLPTRLTATAVGTVAAHAPIPEEFWLAKQKSGRTRCAYRLDVQHFLRTLAIGSAAELRVADHKSVIAWERFMRESEHAAPSTIQRRKELVKVSEAASKAKPRALKSLVFVRTPCLHT
jgi:hypothetical protein